MKKIKDIKLRVPEEYLEPIKEHAKKKGMSVNQLVVNEDTTGNKEEVEVMKRKMKTTIIVSVVSIIALVIGVVVYKIHAKKRPATIGRSILYKGKSLS